MTADGPKFLARRARTPGAGASDGRRSTAPLPDDLVSDQIKRLALASAIAGGLWTNGLVMDQIAVPYLVNGAWNAPRLAIEVAAILACAAMYFYVRYSGRSDRKSTRLNSSHIQKSRMPSSA